VKKVLVLLVSVMLVSCPGGGGGSSAPDIDPTEYIYEMTGTGQLVMGDDSVRPVTLVLSHSNWPDFHVPSSFDPVYRIYVYFGDGSLCLYVSLVYEDGWKVKESSGNPYAYIGYGPYPDGLTASLPYWMSADGLTLETDPGNPEILTGLTFSCDDITGYDPPAAGYAGSVKSLSVDLAFNETLGYGAADYTTAEPVDHLRLMDTRSRLDAVTPEIEAGLTADPVTWAPLLTDALTDGLTDPLQKVRVIHDWIAANIYYDYWWYENYYLVDPASSANDAFVDKSPCAVLKSRKTVCGGYSLLLWYLCRLEGIHVEVVRGWVRSASDPLTRRDHTWCVISVNGTLYHMDTTADSKNQYTAAGVWVPGEHRSEWFLVPPELFCFWSCPYNAADRYPGQPSTGDAFYASPLPFEITAAGSYLTDGFYQAGLLAGGGAASLITTSGTAEINLTLPSGPVPELTVNVLHAFDDAASDLTEAFIERTGTSARIVINPRSPGWRTVRLWQGTEFLGQFVVREPAGTPPSDPFPVHYSDYLTLGAVLTAPERDILTGGETATFTLQVPGATNYYIGSTVFGWQNFSTTDGTLNQAVTLPAGTGLLYVVARVDGVNHTILGFHL
jgi:transglutaminase-like putative cysteine protease